MAEKYMKVYKGQYFVFTPQLPFLSQRMRVAVVVFASLLVVAECSLLQTYSLPNKAFTTSSHHGNRGYRYLPPPGSTLCADGQVLHVGGRCVTPVITRSAYLFNVPQLPRRPAPLPYIPPPKVDHNLLFIRLPEDPRAPDPIVVPPPQQQDIVYILRKSTQREGPRVIQAPDPPKTNPDVYLVGYGQGENPILPTGEALESILANHAQEIYGQVVDSGSSGHFTGDGLHSSHVGIGSGLHSSHVGIGSHGLVGNDSPHSSHVGIGSLGLAGTGSLHSGHVDIGSLGLVGSDSPHSSHVGIGSLGLAGSGLPHAPSGHVVNSISSVGSVLQGLAGSHHGATVAPTSVPQNQGILVTPVNTYIPPNKFSL
ncbi:uncharacterized protein [Macrobrachium rosenbergii]|uniref:uncharacterized protein isoform X2 n=1 Tax=Macrobrachium rosenbergii TaxID=79674 RepID=UPI0034D4652D